ncbi:MAG: lysine--tRNA ligase, partial [Tissierellia bacterium]|nr:lysine--tRNA ligase [Tissierellia bacterium]
MSSPDLNLNEILQLKRDKLKQLINDDNSPFINEKYNVDSYSLDIKNNFETTEGTEVSLAGRILSKRGHGKIMFLDLLDSKGTIQLFAKKDVLGDNYKTLKTIDIGDIVGVKGEVIKTKAGEITVLAKELLLLSKSLQILPEKWHGLKDPDLRYRMRYVDLIVNPEIKEVFIKRTKILKAVREFLDMRGFLEVETPILSTVAGGANARPFLTHHNTLDLEMQLRIANELYLKRLIVGGFDKVYEMGRMFRNEGMDSSHNPEFTSIELYQAYADYEDMMEITEEMFKFICDKVLGTREIEFMGEKIDMSKPFERISMQDAVLKYAGVDFAEIKTDEEAIRIAKEKGLDTENLPTRGHVLNEMFEEFCEEHLIQPTFITGHPVEVSPLAKRNPDDPRITNRFELFINKWEFANAFSELNDPFDQRKRFEDQVKAKEGGDDEAHPMDYDFINAIEVGLPPTGGLGIGIDRTVMLFTNQSSIRDVLFFPTM